MSCPSGHQVLLAGGTHCAIRRGRSAPPAVSAHEQCGFYELLDDGGKAVFSYAVNSDLAETNPATVDPAEIKAALESSTGRETQALAGSDGLGGQSGREIWAYLVAAVLLLTVCELFVANRVVRH